jgi:glycosyltransferase involved in cell wall biosynthesis
MNNKNFPLVSIITPCRNSETYIEETILSVINQTYPNIEYIVVDGGSTDATLEIIRRYEASITRWTSEPDEGMYQAINKGMSRVRGDIVAYLNSDDLYFPDTISKVVDFFKANQSIDVVYGNPDIIDGDGKKLYTWIYPNFNWKRFTSADYMMMGQPATFWRRALMDKIGLFDESMKMASDFDFFIRAGMSGTLGHVSDALAQFRFHSAALSSNQKELNDQEVILIHERYLQLPTGILYYWAKKTNYIYYKLLNWRAMMTKIAMVLRKRLNV